MIVNTEQGSVIYSRLLKAFAEGAEEVTALFHNDAIIEYPYATSLGTTAKLDRDSLSSYLAGALPNMPNLIFTEVKVHSLQAQNAFWAEATGRCTIQSTQLPYEQKYVMYFELTDDLIIYYREYWDLLAIKNAFGSNDQLNETFG